MLDKPRDSRANSKVVLKVISAVRPLGGGLDQFDENAAAVFGVDEVDP
jgi:hypothetical protein